MLNNGCFVLFVEPSNQNKHKTLQHYVLPDTDTSVKSVFPIIKKIYFILIIQQTTLYVPIRNVSGKMAFAYSKLAGNKILFQKLQQ